MDSPYIDIHTHRRTDEGIEVVSVMAGRDLRRAAHEAVLAGTAGVTDLAGTASVESELPGPPFSIGIHPWQIAKLDGGNGGNSRGDFISGELEIALREVETAPAWAIGEIGLDFAPSVVGDQATPADRKTEHENRQRTIFAAQLRIAAERRLPVIVHCVRAFEPTMEILKTHPTLPAVIFHGFIGSPEQAARAVKAGYYLSLGERSLDSPKTVEALKSTPPDKLFLETDDSPTPIAAIYSRAAALLDVPLSQLIKQLYDNYNIIAIRN